MNDHHDEMNDEKFDHWLHSAARMTTAAAACQ